MLCKKIIEFELKQYCKEKWLKEISKSSIERIIKELKEEWKIINNKELHMHLRYGDIKL